MFQPELSRDGINRRLWEKVNNINRDIALKVAREISNIAKEFSEKGETVVVFEKLKGLRGDKKRSKRLNRKINFWMRRKIQERVKEISVEEGFGIDFVHPGYTSKRCSRCGREGERFSPSGSKALFYCKGCGYVVNGDVNAVFNQHFLYLSHLLHGGGKARSVVRVGTSLSSGVPKATATYFYISSLLSTF